METDWEDFECASIFIFIQLSLLKLPDLFIFLYLKLEFRLLRFCYFIIIIIKTFYPWDKFWFLLELTMCWYRKKKIEPLFFLLLKLKQNIMLLQILNLDFWNR